MASQGKPTKHPVFYLLIRTHETLKLICVKLWFEQILIVFTQKKMMLTRCVYDQNFWLQVLQGVNNIYQSALVSQYIYTTNCQDCHLIKPSWINTRSQEGQVKEHMALYIKLRILRYLDSAEILYIYLVLAVCFLFFWVLCMCP